MQGYPTKQYGVAVKRYCRTMNLKADDALIREMPLTELLVESDEQLSVDDIYKRIASDINIDVHELQNQVRNNISQLLHVSF